MIGAGNRFAARHVVRYEGENYLLNIVVFVLLTPLWLIGLGGAAVCAEVTRLLNSQTLLRYATQ